MNAWQAIEPKGARDLGGGVAYSFTCGHHQPADHAHTIECIWVWHDCGQILGPESIAPGARFGWRPSGVLAHTLVELEPLTITASVYWPDCCGMHGFITRGAFASV
ncbi:hypothetical protein CH252_19100 [Rhodococcus sp. 06-1477-1B]|nr:hypothetical protein CH252_19100 [Rhodococcus sp. 06-1477-1B]